MATPHTQEPILPIRIYPYVDKVTVWLKRPLMRWKTEWIEAGCRGKITTTRDGESIWISDSRGRRRTWRLASPSRLPAARPIIPTQQ